MNDLIILAFAVIMLLAVLPMILMSRAFKGAGRKEEGGDASVATMAVGDSPPVKPKAGYGHDDSAGDSGGDGGDGGGGGD